MATLNVKNMPDDLHDVLKQRARRSRRSLSKEVIQLLTDATQKRELHSLLDLRGLGRELWSGIDADRHVAEERQAWD